MAILVRVMKIHIGNVINRLPRELNRVLEIICLQKSPVWCIRVYWHLKVYMINGFTCYKVRYLASIACLMLRESLLYYHCLFYSNVGEGQSISEKLQRQSKQKLKLPHEVKTSHVEICSPLCMQLVFCIENPFMNLSLSLPRTSKNQYLSAKHVSKTPEY